MSGDCADSCAEVAEGVLQNLGEDLPIEQLARSALMPPRTFARRFRADRGMTPSAWLNRQRIIRAQLLLEQTERSLETVAADTGFGAATVMRHYFVKVPHTMPTAYRRAFCEKVPA